MEKDGYRYTEPEEIEPSQVHIDTAYRFLVSEGYNPETWELQEGVGVVANVLALSEVTLEDAPAGHRHSSDIKTSDGRYILVTAIRLDSGVVKGLTLLKTEEKMNELVEKFMGI